MRQEYAIRYFSLMEVHRECSFVFVDEFGTNISMRAERGRFLVGRRAIHVVRSIRSLNISVCAALSTDGILLHKSQASAYNEGTFLVFIQELVATQV